MSFSAENRRRPRLALDGVMGQEPPLKRLRSLLGVDPSVGGVGYGVGAALGFGSDRLSLAAYGRTFPDTSFLGPLRTGLDEKILAASAMPMSLGSLGSLGVPSTGVSFIDCNLPKLEPTQMIPQTDLAFALLANSRSKTKLCKHFIEGRCKYNEICNFAHSIEELKSMPPEGDVEGRALVEKYRSKADAEKQAAGSGKDAISAVELKTKLCKHFIEGECKFNDGCHFAHSIQELKKLPDEGDDAGKFLLEKYKSKSEAANLAAAEGELVQRIEPLTSISTGSMGLKTKLCKHFIVGSCKFKENCTFAHSEEELKRLPGEGDDAGKALLELYRLKAKAEKPLSGDDPAQTNEKVEGGAQAKSKLEKISSDAQQTQKQVSDSSGSASADVKVDDKSIRFMKTKMCRHFLVGACKYMDSCTFAHSIEELRLPATKTFPTASSPSPSKKTSTSIASADQQATPTAQSAQQSDGKKNSDDKQWLHKTKACRFFLDGKCRFGDACTFLHGNEQIHVNGGTGSSGVSVGSGELKSTFKTRLCNMWEKDKTCTFGSKCHFAHGLEELRPKAGPSIPGSSSVLYGGLEMEALSRARQLGLPVSLPYSYEVTDANWRPFPISEEAWNGLGGGMNERGMDTEASQVHLRGLLQNYGQLDQASSLASLSSLGGVNLGLSSSAFANLPFWQTM